MINLHNECWNIKHSAWHTPRLNAAQSNEREQIMNFASRLADFLLRKVLFDFTRESEDKKKSGHQKLSQQRRTKKIIIAGIYETSQRCKFSFRSLLLASRSATRELIAWKLMWTKVYVPFLLHCNFNENWGWITSELCHVLLSNPFGARLDPFLSDINENWKWILKFSLRSWASPRNTG